MDRHAIWKDFNLDFPTRQDVHFTVTERGDSTILYEGRIDKIPGEGVIMPANKICETLLSMNFPTETGVTVHNKAMKDFFFNDVEFGGVFAILSFIYDWSYEPVEYGYNIMTKPINGHMDPRMRFFVTSYSEDNSELNIETT